MDRRLKPVHLKQNSTAGSPMTPLSPSISPLQIRHGRTGSISTPNMKKAHTKAAAQRLAQVMSHQSADDDDEDDDDLNYDYNPSSIGGIGLAGGRRTVSRSPMGRPAVNIPARAKINQPADEDDEADEVSVPYRLGSGGSVAVGRAGGRSMRARSPLTVGSRQEQTPAQTTSNIRPSISGNSVETPSSATPSSAFPPPSQPATNLEEPPSARSTKMAGPSAENSAEQSSYVHPSISGRSSNHAVEHNSSFAGRPSANPMEQPPSARSVRQGIKTVPHPSSVPTALRPVPIIHSEIPGSNRREQRLSLDFGNMKIRGSDNHSSTSALQDEIDMLQEENENLLDKLRVAAEKCEEAEARARQLEKQVATLGEGVTLEARLISRKEAALQQREAALKVAEQTATKSEEMTALKMDAQTAKEEAASAMEHLNEAASEVKSLRNMTQRMMLTQEEMEEVVLKRCWLSWYWNLCVRYGIHADIANARHEYWSSFAPLPFEVVSAAGQRAIEENPEANNDSEERERLLREAREISGEGTVESMLSVEKGLREQASLKVGEAVALAMAQQRRSQILKSDEVKLAGEGYLEAFELSQDESQDVRFKQAWLAYFWRRAKDHELEPDIAEEKLQFWIEHSSRSSLSHDAVDVERGLQEMKKLGLESQLWQASRKGLETKATSKAHLETDF